MSLRQRMRSQRRALSAAAQERHAAAICHHLRASSLRRRGIVAAYAAFDGEPDVWRFIARCARGALPVVASTAAVAMAFRSWRLGEPLRRNRFGIEEPAVGRLVHPLRLAAVLAPLVAFDDAGGRLGMGAGYYDRRFADARRPPLVGVAHGFQRVARLPRRAWDVPLDAVVTERGWRCFTRRGENLRLY